MSKEESKGGGMLSGVPTFGLGAKEEEKKEEKPEVGTMKKGDYMIHVFIETVKQIKMPSDQTVDPIVEVSCLNEKKFSSAKDNVSSTGVVTWMEHIFFEPKNVKVEDIEGAKISIKLNDKGYFKDAMIGIYEFDVAYIYFMKEHVMLHQWVAMSNPSSPDFNEVTAYMKLSISVATTGDPQIQINEDSSGGADDENVMMPPSIKPAYYQLKIRFFRAEKLPIMDAALFGKGGSIDAYILCQHLNQKLKTKVYTMQNELVIWNQEFLIPCPIPIMSGRLVMKVFDEDKLSDEIVGSIIFNMKELIKPEMNGQFFWKNVYGSPLGVSGENTDLMNANPDIGSTWKGRILIQVSTEITEKPEVKVQDLTEEIQELAAPHIRPHEYEIMAEVGVGIALPYAYKYTIKIKIAEFEIKTEQPFQENNYNRWNFRTKQLTYTSPYQSIYDMGRVYVYLMEGDKPIAYHKENIENFMDPNAKLRWIELEPDLSMGKVKEHYQAGIISFKLSIHDKTLHGPIDYMSFKVWKKPIPKRPANKKVRAFVYQCRDLPAADSDGTSDPFIELFDNSKERRKTKYIEDNMNPLFYEVVELVYEANSLEDMPPFVLDVYDKDFGPLDGDDFICRAIVPISEASYTEKDEIPRPKWHQCRLKKGAPACGEILISFAIVEDDFKFKIDLKYVNLMKTVLFDEYVVEVNVLGLRDLQSVGYLPVKKAFIQFNLKSLVPPDCAQAIENIKTQPAAAGPNPTINTLIKFQLPLPGDPLYCPKLSCSVFDNIFKSFLQPLLGTFTIPVGELLFGKQRTKQEELDNLAGLIEELTKILDGLGVVSYNIQSIPLEVDDLDFRSKLNEQKEKLVQNFSSTKSKIKVDAESKAQKLTPLLLDNLAADEVVSNRSGSRRGSGLVSTLTPRKTPRDLMTVGEDGALNEDFDKVQSGTKNLLIKERKEEEEKVRREQDSQREQEMELFKQSSDNSSKVVIQPKYKLDTRLNVNREYDMPPEALFMGLGFDENPEDKKRHYRRFYTEELEKVKEIMPKETPFETFLLKRGQTRGASKGWWPFGGGKKEDDSGQADTELIAGKFKGLITIESEKDKAEYKQRKFQLLDDLTKKLNALSLKKFQKLVHFNMSEFETFEGKFKFKLQMESLGVGHLNLENHLANMQSGDALKRLLLGQTKCLVRVYVISAFDLSSRDNGSPSDPYLNIQLGNKVYCDKDNYILDEPNPDFYKSFDFETSFPGCPPLNIQIYDYDDLFGDDLIGETKIDLEDRFFSPEWQACKQKPIEFRSLYHQSSSMSQGVVKVWVDILKSSLQPEECVPYDITPKPAEKFEVRVVVYDTLNIKGNDLGGVADIFIRTFFDTKEEVKETDTHFRCQDGKASFNYRHLFHIEHPRKNYKISIQAYDRDFFKSNDVIGEGGVNIKLALEDAALAKRPVSINKKYYNSYLKKEGVLLDFKDEDSFWVELIGKDEKGQIEKVGKVRIRVDIYPQAQADMNKVGEVRNEPNTNPFLTPPIGRLSFTLNPLKMFEQLVPPAVRRKIYLGCCLALCCMMCLSMFPMIFSNIIASWFTF